MRLPAKLAEAMKRYYDNRQAGSNGVATNKKWDKQADLEHIMACLPKGASNFQAIAGTFWIAWPRLGIQTQHREDDYLECRLLSRKQYDGTWKEVKNSSPQDVGRVLEEA